MRADKMDTATSIGLLVLRVGIGAFLATHGWGKVQNVFGGKIDQFADPIGIGVVPSHVLAAGAEFGCALLVAVGLFTRLAAIPAAFTMAVAAFIVHAPDPLLMGSQPKAKEPAILYMVPFVALVFTGAGRYSLDAWLAARRDARGAAKSAGG